MPLNDPIIVIIKAKGASLDLGLGARVLSFSYEDVEKGDDLLHVTFADPYHELSDNDQFLENTEWEVQFGFPARLSPTKKFFVKRPKFKHGEVEIEALDKGSKLKHSEHWHLYKKKKVKEIVEDIAARNGLEADVDPELNELIQTFPMGGRSDYDVLKYLQSRSEDHTFKVDGDKLIFKKRGLDKPPVISFKVEPGDESRVVSYSVGSKDPDHAKSARQTTIVGIDPRTFKKIVFKSDEGTSPTSNLGNERPHEKYESDFDSTIASPKASKSSGGKGKNTTQGESTGKSLPMPFTSKKQMEATAKSRRANALLGSIEAEFEIVASPDDPFIESGDIIEMLGIGKRLSGPYQVTKIKHDLSDGYKYTINTGRNAHNKTGKGKGGLSGAQNKKGASGKKSGFNKEIFKSLAGGAA